MPQNAVTIIGNLATDPELRFTSSGQAVARFTVAQSERFRNASTGQWEDGETSYFTVTAWGDLGEHVAESFRRGNRVMVTGQLKQRTWEAPDGVKRYAVEIRADDVAASVRFATVAIRKATRPQQTAASGDPWAAEPAGEPAAEPGSDPAATAPESPAESPAEPGPDGSDGSRNGTPGKRSRTPTHRRM